MTATANRGVFMPGGVPDAVTYAEQHGLRLTGHGKERTTECRIHGGSDSLGINIESGFWLCRNCGAKGGDMLDLHMQVHGLGFVDAARDLGAWSEAGEAVTFTAPVVRPAPKPHSNSTPQHLTLSDAGAALYRACSGLRGTVGEQYLRARRCAVPPVDGALRFHPNLRHPSGYAGPALVAMITDLVTVEPLNLHRTWILADGTKPDIDRPRRVLFGHRKNGGVIRLWPDEFVSYGLGLAEGIETALTLATVLKPVWCTVDASNLGKFPIVPGVEVLTVAADHDPAGLRGATACATRWTEAGRDVRMVVPPKEGADLNDFAREVA